MLNRVTLEKFRGFVRNWNEDDVKAISGQHPDGVTALDVLHCENVSAENKLWAVLRLHFIPKRMLHEFACVCAECASSWADNPDPRSATAIKAKRRWLDGEVSNRHLDNARNAAWNAVWAAEADAGLDASQDARCNAAWFAARSAAEAAARRAAWAAQMAALFDAESAAKSARDAAPDACKSTAWCDAHNTEREAQCTVLEMMLLDELEKA